MTNQAGNLMDHLSKVISSNLVLVFAATAVLGLVEWIFSLDILSSRIPVLAALPTGAPLSFVPEAVLLSGVVLLTIRQSPIPLWLSHGAGQEEGPETGKEEWESEGMLHLAVKSAPNAIVIIDAEGRIVLANTQTEQLFGYSSVELLGQPVELLVPERFRSHHPRLRQDFLSAPETRRLGEGRDLYGRHKNGNDIPIEIGLTPIETGKGLVVLAAIVDISERKHTEEVLREQARLSALIADVGLALTAKDTLPEILDECARSLVRNLEAAFARIWTLNKETNVLELQASAGMYTRLGGSHSRIPVGELKIGRIALERKPHLTNDVPNDPRISDPEWAHREGMVAFAGYPLLVREQLVGVMALFARHPLSPSVLEAMASIANQIALGTLRKHSEERLHFTQFTIDHMATPVFWADSTGHLLEVNEEACKLSGYSRNELLSLRIHDLAPPVTEETWDAIWKGLQQSRVLMRESELQRKEGSVVPIQIQANLLRSKGREYVCTFIQDITRHRKLEEQLLQSQKMEAIGQLAGGVAHDFNNLLTIISGYTELLLQATPATDKRRESLEEIRKAGERATSVTRQLLAFSRKQVLSPKILNLNEVVRDTEKMLHRVMGEDIRLSTQLRPGLDLVKVDPGQLQQVLLNLAVNAQDAMPRGGELVIRTDHVTLPLEGSITPPAQYVMLAISDTGTGMSEEVLTHLFEPFFTTKGPGKGTGLGLAVVHGIVEQSGGHIEVESKPRAGSEFKIFFPLAKRQEASKPATHSSGSVPGGTETILLVEDEVGVRALAKRTLADRGYTVFEASHGDQAVKIANQHRDPIDLLIMDVVMPGLSGRTLSERLLTVHPEMEVLYISGHTDDAVMRHGIEYEDVNFLQKPFSPASLARKVRDVLTH